MTDQITENQNMSEAERAIAILGARGRLGRVVAESFAKAGWKVVAITRDGKPAPDEAAHPNIVYRAADALDAAAIARACADCGYVFNALNPPYTRWHDEALAMADNVIEALSGRDVVHLFAGNVYNFGTTIPAMVDEETTQHGDHPKAAIRIEMERRFEQAAGRGDLQTIILRAGDYFGGTGTGSWFDQVIAAKAAKGVFTYPGPLDTVHAWAYLPDLAQSAVRLAETAASLGAFEVFHFEGHSVTGHQLKQAMEQALARPLKATRLPWSVIRIGGLVVAMWREISQISYLWHRPHRLSGEKLSSVIGKEPHTPLEPAVRQALNDLGIDTKQRITAPARAMPSLTA